LDDDPCAPVCTSCAGGAGSHGRWVCRPRKTGCRSFALYSFHAPTNIMCTQPVGGLPAASIRRRSRRCRSSGGKRSGAGCGDHITIRWWRHRTNDTPPFHLRWKRDDSRTPGYARVGTALRLTCLGGGVGHSSHQSSADPRMFQVASRSASPSGVPHICPIHSRFEWLGSWDWTCHSNVGNTAGTRPASISQSPQRDGRAAMDNQGEVCVTRPAWLSPAAMRKRCES
jgi:hypothetical protein